MSKSKMPMQVQVNNQELCPTFNGLDRLCPIELILVVRMKGAQHGLKEQCVLVPTDLEKIHIILPRPCDEEYLISLALKC